MHSGSLCLVPTATNQNCSKYNALFLLRYFHRSLRAVWHRIGAIGVVIAAQQPQGLALISVHNDFCSVSRHCQTHEQKLYGRGGSHGSGLEPFLLEARHAKIPGKELSKGGEGGGGGNSQTDSSESKY